MRPKRKNPATVVAKSAISHATAPTLPMEEVLAGESAELAGIPAEVDIPEEVAEARSATSAVRLGILPATVMREAAAAAADTEAVMDRAKVDTEAEAAMEVEAVVRAKRAIPVEAMVICPATALKAKNVIIVSSPCNSRKVKL